MLSAFLANSSNKDLLKASLLFILEFILEDKLPTFCKL